MSYDTFWYKARDPYHPDFNGLLTTKQDAMLVFLEGEEDGLATWQLSESLGHARDLALADGYGDYGCIGWEPEGVAATLNRMAARGLVRKEKRGDGSVHWHALVYV